MTAKRLTRCQKGLLAKLRAGQQLRAQLGEPPYFIDGGDAVNARTVKTLIRDGFLRPLEDGLFEGFAQTLVLV